MRKIVLSLMCVAAFYGAPALAQDTSAQPAGDDKSTKTGLLEIGAALLQENSPLRGMDIYLDGFHAAKDNAEHQMEAHHFCRQVNEDLAQCALFDGNTATANLIGIEYIVSEKLFETMPDGERKYWHPHNGEILSGELVAPGLPAVAEKELMKGKMNSYGKTWHVWNTPSATSGHGDKIPLGEPMLMWSFNRKGELQDKLVKDRDARFKYNTSEIAASRQDLKPLAKPQQGVDDMKDFFKGPNIKPIPGVVDKKAAVDVR